MGVGARAGRAVRVCDIMYPVTLSVCGPGPLRSGARSAGPREPTDPACECGCVAGRVCTRAAWVTGLCGACWRVFVCRVDPPGADPPAASLPDLMRWHAQSCVCVCM